MVVAVTVTIPMMVVIMIVPVVVFFVTMVIMAMAAVLMMWITLTGIGAAHRIEGRRHIRHPRAQPFQHRLDDMIATDEDAVVLNRRGEMTITDVPGQFDQMERIYGDNFVERLVGSHDFHMATIMEDNHVAMVEHYRFRQIEEDFAAVGKVDRPAAQMTLVVLQYGFCNWCMALPVGPYF